MSNINTITLQETSITGNLFRQLNAYNKDGDLATRMSAEPGYVALAVASLIETVALALFFGVSFSQFCSSSQVADAFYTCLLCFMAIPLNLVTTPANGVEKALSAVDQKIAKKFQEKWHFFPDQGTQL